MKKFETNKIICGNCISLMQKMNDNSVDLILTDIPYEKVNKSSNGLRQIDKKNANTKTFELKDFLPYILRLTRGSGYIFCGKEQVSSIFDFFSSRNFSTRLLIWEKTNPSPMNGKALWVNSVETFIFFKKPGAIFKPRIYSKNSFRKSVLNYPNGSNKIHPTQKPLALFKDLIETSSNVGDIVFDPCAGSCTTAVASQILDRKYICMDLHQNYCDYGVQRITKLKNKKIVKDKVKGEKLPRIWGNHKKTVLTLFNVFVEKLPRIWGNHKLT